MTAGNWQVVYAYMCVCVYYILMPCPINDPILRVTTLRIWLHRLSLSKWWTTGEQRTTTIHIPEQHFSLQVKYQIVSPIPPETDAVSPLSFPGGAKKPLCKRSLSECMEVGREDRRKTRPLCTDWGATVASTVSSFTLRRPYLGNNSHLIHSVRTEGSKKVWIG